MLGASDCEQLRDGLLAQPVNALSSLAYVAAGTWIATRRPTATGQRWTGRALGAGVAAIGLGSFAFHGPQPAWAATAHDLPILATGALLVSSQASGRVRWWAGRGAPTNRPRLALAVAAGAAGLVAYGLGRTGSPACSPGSLLQWHAVWHGLSAVAVAALATAWGDQVDARPSTTTPS